MTAAHLLVVDDDVDFAESLGDLLKAAGYRVTVAHNGHQALEAGRRERPDLVLMDMKMPDMSGVDCLRRLWELWGDDGVPARMVSAFTWQELLSRAMGQGFCALLTKPGDPAAILSLIGTGGPNRSVLWVEDDADLREEVTTLLRRAGHRVSPAEGVHEALAALPEDPAAVLLADYKLNDGTAADLREQLIDQGRDLPTLLLTGYPDDARSRLRSLGPEDILVKPIEPSSLLAAVREALDGSAAS